MKGGELAGLITALTTFVGGLYGAVRVARAERLKGSSDQSAVLLGGWQTLNRDLIAEVERVRKSCQEEIRDLKSEHERDRAQWMRERDELRAEVRHLRLQVVSLIQKASQLDKAHTVLTDAQTTLEDTHHMIEEAKQVVEPEERGDG